MFLMVSERIHSTKDKPGTSSGTGFLQTGGSNQPTTLTFDPVRSSQLRLDMTSAAPGTGGGFLMIAELQARSGG